LGGFKHPNKNLKNFGRKAFFLIKLWVPKRKKKTPCKRPRGQFAQMTLKGMETNEFGSLGFRLLVKFRKKQMNGQG